MSYYQMILEALSMPTVPEVFLINKPFEFDGYVLKVGKYKKLKTPIASNTFKYDYYEKNSLVSSLMGADKQIELDAKFMNELLKPENKAYITIKKIMKKESICSPFSYHTIGTNFLPPFSSSTILTKGTYVKASATA